MFLGMGGEIFRPGALFLICQESVEQENGRIGSVDRVEWLKPALLFSIDIEPDFLLPIGDGHVSFS